MMARFPDDGTKLVRFWHAGALLVLSEKELVNLLRQDIDLWIEAIRRGKAVLRAERARRCQGDSLDSTGKKEYIGVKESALAL